MRGRSGRRPGCGDCVVNRASELWSSGDYPQIAARFEPIAADLLAALGAELAGRRLLDLAAGTGNVALAAATRGAIVTATDITPRMVQLGRARTAAAGLEVTWALADVGALPLRAASFDVITSCFGVMFAADPTAAVAEMARVLRPGGRIALISWCADRPNDTLWDPLLGQRPRQTAATADPSDWGRPHVLAGWLRPAFTEVVTARRPFSWDFPTVTAALDYFLTASPRHAAALAALPPHEQTALRIELSTRLTAMSAADVISLPSPYLLVTARRR